LPSVNGLSRHKEGQGIVEREALRRKTLEFTGRRAQI
jgi:hypothetical protein